MTLSIYLTFYSGHLTGLFDKPPKPTACFVTVVVGHYVKISLSQRRLSVTTA